MDDKNAQMIAALMRRLRQLNWAEPRRQGIDSELTFSQMALIQWVVNHPGSHVREIATGLEITAPSASVAVNKLVRSGWLQREPDPEDGRATRIFVTKRAERIHKRAMELQQQGIALFLSGLTRTEQTQLMQLLEKAVSSAETQLATED